TAPVVIPGTAAGNTTRRTVCHWAAPTAKLACRKFAGTARNASSEVRRTIGTMMTPKANEPAQAENRGGSNALTTTAEPKIQIIIEGTPASSSPTKRTDEVNQSSRHSARAMAANSPIGTAPTVARATNRALPTSAWARPPPGDPGGAGSSVKNAADNP